MSVEFYWRLPLHGCHGNHLKGVNRGDWSPLAPGNIAPGLRHGEPDGSAFIDHTAEIAKAAELAGFYGALVISFPNSEEAWITSATLARETKALRFLIAFQPNFEHPVYAARQAATLQRISGGRCEWNIITGGGGPGQRWYGDYSPHEARYDRTREFLEVVEAEFRGEPYSYNGKIFQVENGGLIAPHSLEKRPKIFLSGSSDTATDVAAKHAELQLNWLESDESIANSIRRARERGAAAGRELKYAIRVDIVARQTEEEAWREIDRAWDKVDPATIKARLSAFSAGDAVGALRQRGNRPEDITRWQDLIVGPNRFAGLSLLRGGQGNGFVGSYQNVAEQLNGLIDMGVGAFIFAGTPHLEEAYRVGEEILPLLRQRETKSKLQAAE